MTVRKKSSETGAKKVMRAVTGPGVEPVRRVDPDALARGQALERPRQASSPSPERVFPVGEIVPAGKSKPAKSVVMVSVEVAHLRHALLDEGVGPLAEAARAVGNVGAQVLARARRARSTSRRSRSPGGGRLAAVRLTTKPS